MDNSLFSTINIYGTGSKRENELLKAIIGKFVYEEELKKSADLICKLQVAPKGTKSALAKELGVSRGMVYYRHKQPDKDEHLRRQIESLMLKHPGYGHKRVADDLKISRKRARRIMKLCGLKPARRAKAPSKPNDQGKQESNAPDMLSKLSPIARDTVWVASFTYIWFHSRHVYLATVMDRFTREVLGVSIMTDHSAELVVRALTMALHGADSTPQWFHSDQGSEHTSYAITHLLEHSNIHVSYSPKSSPWRNGSQGSFFGRFTVEFRDPERFATMPELMDAIYCYISYYNADRIHSAHRAPPLTARERHQATRTRYPQFMSLPRTPSRPCGAEKQPVLLI